jgi:hypothetical protein
LHFSFSPAFHHFQLTCFRSNKRVSRFAQQETIIIMEIYSNWFLKANHKVAISITTRNFVVSCVVNFIFQYWKNCLGWPSNEIERNKMVNFHVPTYIVIANSDPKSPSNTQFNFYQVSP